MTVVLKILAWAGKYIGHWFSKSPDSKTFHRILIFQAGGVGDIVRIFPVMMSLKKQLPKATLESLSPFSDTVYQLFPDPSGLDERIEYEPRRQHGSLASKLRLARSLRKRRYDLIINPARGEGMIENAILSWIIGAPCRVGFEKKGAGFLNTVKVPLQDDVSITRQNLDLLAAIGIPPMPAQAGLRIPAEGLAYANAFLQSHLPADHKLIAIQPGNHWRQELRWPQDRYAKMIDGLAARHPCVIVLLGTQAESDLNQWIASRSKTARSINLAGKTSLVQMAAILARADLFIGNDSGPLHLALALAVPAVGIFGYTLPEQVIAPVGPCIALRKGTRESAFLHEPFRELKSSAAANPIELVEVDDVLQAAETLLSSRVSLTENLE